MAVIVATNGLIKINSVDLSDHCTTFTLNYGQETKEATAINHAARIYRAGVFNLSLDATFRNDHASASVEQTLRALLIGSSSTGVTVQVQKTAGSSAGTPTSTTNPLYSFQALLNGDLHVLALQQGEVDEITANFVPYSPTITIQTTSS